MNILQDENREMQKMDAQDYMQEVSKQSKNMETTMSLPAKEGIMFAERTPYLCGSDYSEEYLSTPVEDLDFSWEDLHGYQDEGGEWNV